MDNSKSLLQWSILNSDIDQSPQPPTQHREPIDPKWIEIILGKPDAVRLKELATLMELHQAAAFDEFELLIENLDNANDLLPLKLWPRLYALLKTQEESKWYTLWICATAIQNNPPSQDAFLKTCGLQEVLPLLKDPSERVRQKALFCISSAVRGHDGLLEMFVGLEGLESLASVIRDCDFSLMTRTLFLLSNLLKQENSTIIRNALINEGINGLLLCLLPEVEDLALFEELVSFFESLGLALTQPEFAVVKERAVFFENQGEQIVDGLLSGIKIE